MSRFFTNILVALFFSYSLGISLIAVVAALGFIHSSFDFFNNLQPFILTGATLSLIIWTLLISSKFWRKAGIVIAIIGLLSSFFIVLPDIITRFTQEMVAMPDDDDDRTYKIFTYNIFAKNIDAARVIKEIEKERPDFIALQEYFWTQRNIFHPLLKQKYPFFEICKGGKRNNIAIYSKIKFNLDNASSCSIGDDHRISRLIANFKTKNNKTFSIVTTHLDWPIQLSKLDNGKNLLEGIGLMLERKRAQFANLSQVINNISKPLLLVGDLNSTSWSYSLRSFAKSSNLTLNTRAMPTFPNSLYIAGAWRDVFPLISLDHVLTSPEITLHKIYKGDPAGSDHNPIVAIFSIGNDE